MAWRKQFTPASTWRAFFILAVLASTPVFAGPAPTAPQPDLAQVGKPNAQESARILERFRHSGWLGYIEFDLRALPRRGDEAVYHGRLWGGQNDQGAVIRIEISDAKGTVHRFLLQNGDHAAVWRATGNNVAQIETAELFDPLIPGVEVTAFDLQMPFLYWPGANVESIERVRGRPAYVFAFMPPPSFAARNTSLRVVRAYFDAQFNAPVQIQLVGARQVLKTTSLIDLKKVGEQWIPRSFDVRNDVSRDKTRFEVTAVALNLEFSSTVFAPASLNDDIRPPASDRLVRVEQ